MDCKAQVEMIEPAVENPSKGDGNDISDSSTTAMDCPAKRPRNEEENLDAPLGREDAVVIPTSKRAKTGNFDANGKKAGHNQNASLESTEEYGKTFVRKDYGNKPNKNSTQKSGSGNSSSAAHSSVSSVILTRRRASEKAAKESASAKNSRALPKNGNECSDGGSHDNGTVKGRWRVHQMTEDYVHMVAKMMFPATQFRPYGYDTSMREYPIEDISPLRFLKSPLRRPSVIERWSPYEVAVFEAALLHYGKEFNMVSKEIGTKSTKEVIDFYYTWKKTAHYKKWKSQYVSDADLLDIGPPSKGGIKK